ncbi:MAG: hypothetical protein ACAH89_08015, partial [Rariglobus sp.]
MNPIKTPLADTRIPCLRLLTALLFTPLATVLPAQETITVDANTVVRDIPAGLGGACFQGKFWESLSPNYRDGVVETRTSLGRMGVYPVDTNTTNVGSLEQTDIKVAQLLNLGVTPFFIQCIEAETNTTYKNALLRLDGTLYPAGDATPINQRVATNMTYLVNRYK